MKNHRWSCWLLVLSAACNATSKDGNDSVGNDGGSVAPPVSVGAGGTAATACPRNGTVAATMRDVERDAEGVSYSVFGAYPARTPDWKRASGILSLLKGVWSAANKTCADLPVDAVGAVNKAISTLDTAIPSMDQATASRAANDIHLQMAPLFAYFNPTTPIEVVRMDAVFLRAGIDAHFGDWPAYQKDLSSLVADWMVLRARSDQKVPTCHRVAGTQSVVGDLDQTLATMQTAAMSMSGGTIETQSDAGLLEVDILELLFDCPPDGMSPSQGVGAPCKVASDCATEQVCDTTNRGGLCAPDSKNTHVGQPCVTTVDCGTDPRAACNNEVGDGYPGGYCAMEPCNDVEICSPGATCVSLPFETPACLKSCALDSDCRASEGYVCQLFPTTPPAGFGPTDHACAFKCQKDEDCTSPLKCEVSSGKCTP